MDTIIDTNAFQKSQKRAKKNYDKYSDFQQEIATRLLSRLPFMKIDPLSILDCGGDAFTRRALQENYPKANIIQHPLTELNTLPYEAQSMDLIFSNLALHWAEDTFQTLAAFRRLLKKDGLLLFSTLGPDTLLELHQSFMKAEEKWHVHPFMDMHPIGDELLRLQFYEPVVDMEKIVFHYECLADLFLDLKKTGIQNALKNRPRGLQGKNAWKKMQSNYKELTTEDGYYPVTSEIIYGQAWVNGPRLATLGKNNEAVFSLENGLPHLNK